MYGICIDSACSWSCAMQCASERSASSLSCMWLLCWKLKTHQTFLHFLIHFLRDCLHVHDSSFLQTNWCSFFRLMLVTPTNIYKLDGSVGTFVVKVRAVSVGRRGDRRGHGGHRGSTQQQRFPQIVGSGGRAWAAGQSWWSLGGHPSQVPGAPSSQEFMPPLRGPGKAWPRLEKARQAPM